MERRRFLKSLAWTCGLAGCGGSNNTSLPCWLRLVHAVPDAEPVRLFIDGVLVTRLNGANTWLDYGSVSSLLRLNPGRVQLAVEDEPGHILLDRAADLAEDRVHVVMLHGKLNAGPGDAVQGATVFAVNYQVPRNRCAVRVYHAVGAAGPLEVIYRERDKPTVVSGRLEDVAVASSLAFGEVTNVVDGISEPYLVRSAYGDLIVRSAGQTSDLVNQYVELVADQTLNVALVGEDKNLGLITWY